MQCPRCQGPDFQALSFIFQSGLTYNQSSSSGVGGLAGGGVGAYGGKIKGTSTTALAMRAAPPVKKKYGWFIGLAIVSFFFVSSYAAASLGVALFGFLAYRQIKWNKTTWPGLYDGWLHQFMCTRCGSIVDSLEAATPQSERIAVQTNQPTPLSSDDPGVLPSSEI